MKIKPTTLDSSRTVRFVNVRTRKPEVWAATSACGRWSYIRTEEVGTPWFIQDNHDLEAELVLASSLLRARRYTAEQVV